MNVILAWVMASIPALLMVTGAVNVAYEDCWGDERAERLRWFVASWLRIIAGLTVLGLEIVVLAITG